jgi:hypothetical protein
MKECGLPRGVYTQVKERGAQSTQIFIPTLIHKIERCCKIYTLYYIYTHMLLDAAFLSWNNKKSEETETRGATFPHGIIPFSARVNK